MGKIKQYSIVIGIWVLTIVAVYFYTRHRFKISIPKTVRVEVPYEKPVYYTDPNGVTHAQFESVQVQRDIYKRQLDSVSKLLKIKSKDINSINSIITNTGISVQGDSIRVIHDTVYQFAQVNPYYTIKGNIDPNKWSLDLSLPDTLHSVIYTKYGLFSPNKTYLDISNSNPYVRILGGKSVVIEQKKPILTIGPYIGYEIFPKEHLSIGISIQHPFITIH